MTKVMRLTDSGPHELVGGVRMYPLWGEGVMLNLVDLDANAVVPLHSHPHEQMGFVVNGEITMTIDGVDHRLLPDDAYQIPGGVEHAARAGEGGCRVLDVFQPVREDYVAIAEGTRRE
jgi:quercetin dioxygenase-like cupin family protein